MSPSINIDFFETTIGDDQEFLSFAKTYGVPINSRAEGEIIETLVAHDSMEAKKDSLSRRYGLGAFPIHTDCAYLKIPPRLILLRYIGTATEPAPTVIVHFDASRLTNVENDFLRNKIWFVRSKNIGFYSPIFGSDILRYDTEVMSLVNRQEDIMPSILSKMPRTTVSWSTNKVLIINNHRALHYRPDLHISEKNNRILQRINIL